MITQAAFAYQGMEIVAVYVVSHSGHIFTNNPIVRHLKRRTRGGILPKLFAEFSTESSFSTLSIMISCDE